MVNYKDVTEEWLKKAKLNYQEVKNVTSVLKNGKRYIVNNKNKIILKNREYENGVWFVKTFGGRIEFLPVINEVDGVSISDYMYYKSKYSKGIFLEEKETNGRSINSFWHALQNKEKQANIFLIDCTNSNLSNIEIFERISMIFQSRKTKFVQIVIIKNGNSLIGVFERK